jgi:protein-tyrosine phosphatase
LRTDAELSERGRFPVDQHDVAFHHLPVLDRTWLPGDVPPFDNANEFLLWAYADMMRVGSDKLAAALEVIATAGDTPLVFHCAAGKDRTGMLAMLVLGCLDVLPEYIVADYALTAEGMERMREWSAREYPELHARIMAGPAVFSAAVPEAMLRMIGHVNRRHGSIKEFALALGVPSTAIDHLRSELLD